MSCTLAGLTAFGLVSRVYANVTEQQIEQAVDYQARHPGVKLGDAMRACGALDNEALEAVLKKQEALRAQHITVQDALRFANYAIERTHSVAELIGHLPDLPKEKEPAAVARRKPRGLNEKWPWVKVQNC
jgi:hypothetical protein